MIGSKNFDEVMNQFRIASRELFNHYFRIDDPYASDKGSWALEERFGELQRVLFDKMVAEPAGIESGNYGRPQERIVVKSRIERSVPAMINREMSCGYWDYPVKEIPAAARLIFVSFFDWDQLAARDNRYVRVQINEWPGRSEANGKHALIESNLVEFSVSPV